jgi:hypothetical protein
MNRVRPGKRENANKYGREEVPGNECEAAQLESQLHALRTSSNPASPPQTTSLAQRTLWMVAEDESVGAGIDITESKRVTNRCIDIDQKPGPSRIGRGFGGWRPKLRLVGVSPRSRDPTP